jgi:hypothetical protein
MAATVRINEYNGAGATETTGITNSNYGSSDTPNLTASSNPITAGTNSYEKWQKLEVTAMGGSTAVQGLKIWYTGTLSGSDALKTNARTSSYAGAATFATPTQSTSSVATQAMPTSVPGSANLGIGGSLSGSLTATGKSDYLVTQLQVDAATVAGATLTAHWRYTEVA